MVAASGERLGQVLDALEWLSRDLARHGYQYAGLPREVARVLVADALAEAPGGCARCGGELPPVGPRGGRPRRFCLTCKPSKTSTTLERCGMATKNGCGCRVPLVGAGFGLDFETAEAAGVEIAPDWAGRPSVSVEDARRVSEQVRGETEERRLAWEQVQRDVKAWAGNRDKAVAEAHRRAHAQAIGAGKNPGEAHARAREAGREAGEKYERTVPRPTFGTIPNKKLVALLFIDESEVASPVALLRLADQLDDRVGVA